MHFRARRNGRARLASRASPPPPPSSFASSKRLGIELAPLIGRRRRTAANTQHDIGRQWRRRSTSTQFRLLSAAEKSPRRGDSSRAAHPHWLYTVERHWRPSRRHVDAHQALVCAHLSARSPLQLVWQHGAQQCGGVIRVGVWCRRPRVTGAAAIIGKGGGGAYAKSLVVWSLGSVSIFFGRAKLGGEIV